MPESLTPVIPEPILDTVRISFQPPRIHWNNFLNSWFQTFAVFWMSYSFFWVVPQRLNFICRRFGTLCLFHLHRHVGVGRILHKLTCLWRWNIQSVPKRRNIKFRRRGITKKKAYNFLNISSDITDLSLLVTRRYGRTLIWALRTALCFLLHGDGV